MLWCSTLIHLTLSHIDGNSVVYECVFACLDECLRVSTEDWCLITVCTQTPTHLILVVLKCIIGMHLSLCFSAVSIFEPYFIKSGINVRCSTHSIFECTEAVVQLFFKKYSSSTTFLFSRHQTFSHRFQEMNFIFAVRLFDRSNPKFFPKTYAENAEFYFHHFTCDS